MHNADIIAYGNLLHKLKVLMLVLVNIDANVPDIYSIDVLPGMC